MELRLWTVVLAVAAVGGCTCFQGTLDDYACQSQADCEPPRLCTEISTGERYCILPEADAGTDSGPDAGPIPCTGDGDCSALDGDCTDGVCQSDFCTADPINEGMACGAGLFCVDNATCQSGSCVGDATCVPDANPCTLDCDEAALACGTTAPMDGMACDDGDACSGPDTCLDGTCSGPGCDDGYDCTVDSCGGAACSFVRDESACAGSSVICNPVAYTMATGGCGAAPGTLTMTCPATAAGGTETCVLMLSTSGGGPVPGEADRIICTTRSRPLVLFEDSFDAGWAAAWMMVAGPLDVSTDLPTGSAATATTSPGTTATLTLPVAGLDVVCVDFGIAFESGADAGESITWSATLDGGGPSTIFSMTMGTGVGTWQENAVMFTYNRNVCVSTTTATSLELELALVRNNLKVYVDDVVVTGLAAPLGPLPPLTGADEFADLLAWMTSVATGTIQVLDFDGDSSVVADADEFTLTRTFDATGCDVVDVDFDFGFDSPDNDESIELWFAVGTGGSQLIEDVNLGTVTPIWDAPGALLPWFGLRRVTDLDPGAANAPMLSFQFGLEATGGGRLVAVDTFLPRCADLPDATAGAVTDSGGGMYSVEVTSPAGIDVEVACTWSTSNDPPLPASGTISFP